MRLGHNIKGIWLTFDHSVFFIDGSSHSYHRALHCFGVLRTSKDDILALEEGQLCLSERFNDIPLVLAVFCDSGFKDFVLGVLLIWLAS